MYRRPKFLEVLIRIREEMAREADYDTDLFAEMVRSGQSGGPKGRYSLGEAQPPKTVKKQRSGKSGR
jgi:hypothetical protein